MRIIEELTRPLTGELEGWKLHAILTEDRIHGLTLKMDFRYDYHDKPTIDAPRLKLVYNDLPDDVRDNCIDSAIAFFTSWAKVAPVYLVERGDRYFDADGNVTSEDIRYSGEDYFFAGPGQTQIKAQIKINDVSRPVRLFINAVETLDDEVWKELKDGLKLLYNAPRCFQSRNKDVA